MDDQKIDLDIISEQDLMKVRICDLPIRIEGTWLEECVQQLYSELQNKGLVFMPTCYLADEWLTPENQTCIGIPFYLAHPILTKIEKKNMLEAEGETKLACMKLLRHEAGHALTYAYKLNNKRKWREIFGSSSQEYGDTYRFYPYSKNYVRHLDGFYAQYHPDEDFVETFAVWLTPGFDWEKFYSGWNAIHKLRYVDHLMKGLRGKAPIVTANKKYWYFKKLKIVLERFYDRKMRLLAEELPHFHDGNLKKIFQEATDDQEKNIVLATDILRKYRKNILDDVAIWTGEKKYVINDLYKKIYNRCQAIKLFLRDPETIAVMKISVYITTLIMNYFYTGWYRGDKKRRVK